MRISHKSEIIPFAKRSQKSQKEDQACAPTDKKRQQRPVPATDFRFQQAAVEKQEAGHGHCAHIGAFLLQPQLLLKGQWQEEGKKYSENK